MPSKSALTSASCPFIGASHGDTDNETPHVLTKNDHHRSTAYSSELALFTLTPEGQIANWNPAARRLYGYSAHEINGKSLAKLVLPSKMKGVLNALRLASAGEPTQELRSVHRNKKRRQLEVAMIFTPLLDRDGKVDKILALIHIAEPRGPGAKALRDSEPHTHAILESAVDGIITISERGIIESANPAAQKLFGYSHHELLGKNVSLLMPQPYRAQHNGYLRNYLHTGKAKIIGIGREVIGQRKDGSTFPFNLSISEVRLGKHRLFAGIVHDLSERRELERRILEASANEQRRIGRDIHDGLCQELIGLGFAAELLSNQLAAHAPKQAKTANDLGQSIRLAAVHAFIWAARHGQFDDLTTPSIRILTDSDPPLPAANTAPNSPLSSK